MIVVYDLLIESKQMNNMFLIFSDLSGNDNILKM